MLRLDWNLLWTILNLLIFYVLIRKFLIHPVLSIMEKRENLIEGQLKDAKAQEAQAAASKAEYEAALASAKEEAAAIVEQAKSEAKEKGEAIVREAEAEAGKQLIRAKQEAEAEKERARMDVQTEVAGLAMAAVAKILESGSDADSDAALYRQFLKKAGGANDTDGR